MYCIDTEALVFMFNGGSPYGFNSIYPNMDGRFPKISLPHHCIAFMFVKKNTCNYDDILATGIYLDPHNTRLL